MYLKLSVLIYFVMILSSQHTVAMSRVVRTLLDTKVS